MNKPSSFMFIVLYAHLFLLGSVWATNSTVGTGVKKEMIWKSDMGDQGVSIPDGWFVSFEKEKGVTIGREGGHSSTVGIDTQHGWILYADPANLLFVVGLLR